MRILTKILTTSAAALSILAFAPAAHAQDTANLFFEGDMVRGGQPGAPGPFCVTVSQFKRMEKVVFRTRVLDSSGKSLDGSGIKSLTVLLPNGTKLPVEYGPHPPPRIGPTTDHFWSVAWIVPDNHPSGTFAYKVVATTTDGKTKTWEPFKVHESQLTILDAAIEQK